jgi:uncharacterized membrane protein YkoI
MMIAGIFPFALDAAERSVQRDHDAARASVAAGERLLLSQILTQIERSHGGRVIEIESDRDNGREVYEIELLDNDGRVIELEIDAMTGEVLETEYDD